MAYATVDEIKDCGFTYEGYGIAANAFNEYLDRVITSQSKLLEIKIGSAYESTDSGTLVFVKRAEICMICAEMLTRRMNVYMQGDAKVEGLDAFKIRRQIEQYNGEATAIIDQLNNSGTTISKGFTSEAVTYDEV